MAERSGAGAENITNSFSKMSKPITDAGDGLTTSIRALDKLGLTYNMLAKLSPEEQFNLIVTELEKVSNKSKKAAISMDIFGKGGKKLIPMINSFSELREEVEGLNIVISDDAVQAGADLTDQLTDLKRTLTAIVANSGFLDWLQGVIDGMKSIATLGVSGIFKEIFGGSYQANTSVYEEDSFRNKLIKKASRKGDFTEARRLAGNVKDVQKRKDLLADIEKKEIQYKKIQQTKADAQAKKEEKEKEAELKKQEQLRKKQEREQAKKDKAYNEMTEKGSKEAWAEMLKTYGKLGTESVTKNTKSTNSIKRIGGALGGVDRTKLNLDTKRNEILSNIEKSLLKDNQLLI
jgi:hypothetical protein